MNIRKAGIDFETRSEEDIKNGAYKYAVHPSTEVLCLAYKYKGRKGIVIFSESWDWDDIKKDHPLLVKILTKKKIKIRAHNANFERYILFYVLHKRFGWPALGIKKFRCTAVKAAAHALPRSLEGAGAALGIKLQKDKEGHKVMLKLCKPRAAWKKSGKGPKYFCDPADLEKLYSYCIRDVDAEELVDEALDDLPEYEQNLWFLDQKINERGFLIDVKTITLILGMIDDEVARQKAKTQKITGGLLDSPLQRNALIEFLDGEGVRLPNAKAKTIKEALEGILVQEDGDGNSVTKKIRLTETARLLLQVRQALGKTSTAKYKAFLKRVTADDRVRDLLLFWAASTGRWGGKGVQVQNFPRGSISNIDLAISVIQTGDVEFIKLIYGDDLMSVFSSVLRGMLMASPGKTVFGVDYTGIELRVLMWMAGAMRTLKLIKDGADLYCYQATDIFGKLVTKEDKAERFVGKEAVLGSGFGMGGKKFKSTLHLKGRTDITEKFANQCVKSYRSQHPEVPAMWTAIEEAAIKAVVHRGKRFKACKTEWVFEGRFLFCYLPSGRRLAYCDPKVHNVERWGKMKPALTFMAVNPRTRKWDRESTWGGKLTENVVQAVSRDLTADAVVKCEAAGLEVLMTVHDEVVPEAPDNMFTVKDVENILLDAPAWAAGLPIACEGWANKRYKK